MAADKGEYGTDDCSKCCAEDLLDIGKNERSSSRLAAMSTGARQLTPRNAGFDRRPDVCGGPASHNDGAGSPHRAKLRSRTCERAVCWFRVGNCYERLGATRWSSCNNAASAGCGLIRSASV